LYDDALVFDDFCPGFIACGRTNNALYLA